MGILTERWCSLTPTPLREREPTYNNTLKGETHIDQIIREGQKRGFFTGLRYEWTMPPRIFIMTKQKFISNSLLDCGPVIQVKITSTHKYASIDYHNNIPERFVIINAIIDTGATHSIIDASILESGIEIEERLKMPKIPGWTH